MIIGDAVVPDAVPAIMVATVSEDGAAGHCGRQVIARILQMAGSKMPVEEHAWSFDAWDKPDGLAAAGRRAGAADILVVAVYRDTTAWKRVIEWLQHWVAPQRARRGALVCVGVERQAIPGPSDPAGEQLACVAHQMGMDFFATTIDATAVPDAEEDPPFSFPL